MAVVQITGVVVEGVTVDSMFLTLTDKLSAHKSLRVERPNAGTLVVHHRYTPGWAVILGIIGLFFFLLGLLFFLVKSWETATILGTDGHGEARFTASGRTSDEAWAVIHRALGIRVIGISTLDYSNVNTGELRHVQTTTPLPGSDVLAANIEQLAALHERGVLTDDEFRQAKARLLTDDASHD